MKQAIVASMIVATLFTAVGGAQAQTAVSQRSVRGILGLGVTGGGDTLASASYTDGTTQKIRAGGLVHVYAGAEFRVAPQVTLQATLGYHADDTRAADNGSLRFTRYPLEVLGHFQVDDAIRIGGGIRLINSAKLVGRGVLGNINDEFDSTVGLVIEGEYLFARQFGVKLRGVSEEYKSTRLNGTASGSHVGAYFSWYW
jgi:hypothetical protein